MHENDRKKRREELKQDPRDFEHRMHHAKMGLLTFFGKSLLPEGYWTSRGLGTAGDINHRVMHLTFDDGPHPDCTPELLDMLKEMDCTATFFFIGEHARRYPKLVEDVYRAGHTIGNHSLSHSFLPLLTRPQLEYEIDQSNQILEVITGEKPKLFRPPFGIIDKRGADMLKQRQMKAVYWGAVADDWQEVGTEVVVKRIMRQVGGHELIVLHEGHSLGHQNVNAARQLIERLRQMGFDFGPVV